MWAKWEMSSIRWVGLEQAESLQDQLGFQVVAEVVCWEAGDLPFSRQVNKAVTRVKDIIRMCCKERDQVEGIRFQVVEVTTPRRVVVFQDTEPVVKQRVLNPLI